MLSNGIGTDNRLCYEIVLSQNDFKLTSCCIFENLRSSLSVCLGIGAVIVDAHSILIVVIRNVIVAYSPFLDPEVM